MCFYGTEYSSSRNTMMDFFFFLLGGLVVGGVFAGAVDGVVFRSDAFIPSIV